MTRGAAVGRRLGVIGTMVWDRIHARDRRAEPVEEWGGIAYALAGAAAALPVGWTLVPVLKIGRDLEHEAVGFLRQIPGLDLETAVRGVDAPNNRVELRYLDSQRRTERLTGGVPAWLWDELAPVVRTLDALYINFISGFELDLATAALTRVGFAGPIYADLHSLFLGVDPGGLRTPRPLASWRDWLRCFDVVQVNQDELGWLAGAWGDPFRFAAEVVGDAPRLLLATLGARGAAYVASSDFTPEPLHWRRRGLGLAFTLGNAAGPVRTERIAPPADVREGDPTGCGDVWGATCFARLLAGDGLHGAMTAAARAAGLNVAHRGATGLHLHLQGRLGA